MDPEAITEMIQQTISDAKVHITDLTGTRDHFSVVVVSSKFEGLLPLKQHRMVNSALAAPLASGEIHALQLKTLTPTEWEDQA